MRKVERLVNLVALLLDTHRPLTLDQVSELDLDPGAGPDALRANLDGASPMLATLLDAVTRRKRIVFTYRPPGRLPSERQLEPYALVHRRGTWYVAGHDTGRDAVRSFRLSRVQSAVRLARPTGRGPEFEVPDWFDA